MSSGCAQCGTGPSKNCDICAERKEAKEEKRLNSQAARLGEEQAARERRLDNEAKQLRNQEAALRLEKMRREFEQQKKAAGD